ncbi:MAG: hypothetical protein ACOZB3_01680 [Calditrichota bacterium]
MHHVARFRQFATAIAVIGIAVFGFQAFAEDAISDSTHPPILFDTQEPPGILGQGNPYRILTLMASAMTPVLNHEGKPHEAGNVIQIIADGGNGVQDSPNPDGTPGGDDLLAYGNFNMMRVLPADQAPDGSGREGLFMPVRYFIPFSNPTKAYYLRIWEGKDIATAPYYQDTKEYDAGDDRGGAMLFLRVGEPADVYWTFGASQPRPTAEPEPAPH